MEDQNEEGHYIEVGGDIQKAVAAVDLRNRTVEQGTLSPLGGWLADFELAQSLSVLHLFHERVAIIAEVSVVLFS